MGDNTTPLYNPNDGVTGRDGGPYFDEVQAQQDELRRARVEKREPDLDNPGANAGIQLSTAGQMLATLSASNLPSRYNARETVVNDIFEGSKEKFQTVVFDEVPDTSGQETNEDLDKDDDDLFNEHDPNAPVSASSDDKDADKSANSRSSSNEPNKQTAAKRTTSSSPSTGSGTTGTTKK